MRSAGIVVTTVTSGSDQTTEYRQDERETAVTIQYRGMVGGVWQPWITAFSSGWQQGGWSQLFDVEHVLGDFENAEVRAVLTERNVLIGTFSNPGVQTYPQAQWADFAISARAVLK